MNYALCDFRMATRGSNMQRRPSLTVRLVHVGIMIQEERHHVHAAIYAGLWRRDKKGEGLLPCKCTLLLGCALKRKKHGCKQPSCTEALYKHHCFKADTDAESTKHLMDLCEKQVHKSSIIFLVYFTLKRILM